MASTRYLRLCSALLLFLLLPSPSASQQCYYPNGQPVKPGSLGPAVPCPGSDSCCLETDICFTGGMCFSSENGATYRGFCVDSAWSSSSSCPSQCATGGSMWMWVNSCGSAQSCCAGSDSSVDCCNGSKFFWDFQPLLNNGGNGGSSATVTVSAPTGPVSRTTTVVATVTSVDTLISYTTGDAGASGSVPVSVVTVTAKGVARGRCEGWCGIVREVGMTLARWL